MSRTIYLASYDRYLEVLEYYLPEGRYALRERAEYIPLTRGAFTREDSHVVGIFATPDGLMFFFDSEHLLLRFGKALATVTQEPGKPVMHFALTAEDSEGKTHAFALRYAERHGIGTNPYDNEIEDVDLLAMIARGLGYRSFFDAYIKDWL